MKHVFVDFEMHPISKEHIEEKKICSSEIIEFGAVMLEEQYNEISFFKEYVNPQYVAELYGRIRVLTGITPPMLSGARQFNEVFQSFLSWCSSFKDDYIVYAWSGSDLEQLMKEMKLKNTIQDERVEKLLANWVDFQKEYCEMVKAERLLSLDKALSVIGQYYQGEMHDALWDARNTAELFAVSRNQGEFFKSLKPIAAALDNTKTEIFTFSLGEIFNFDACKMALA